MTQTFEEVVTRKQRDSLVSDSVKALTDLVGLPERKDLLKKIEIYSQKHSAPFDDFVGGVWADHKESICLTKKGLERMGSCKGHQRGGGLYSPTIGYVKCSYEGSRQIISESKYPSIVEAYELVPDQISKLKERITKKQR